MYTPWTNLSNPTKPGLYLTKLKPAASKNLVKMLYWTGERWMLSGNMNDKNTPYQHGPYGRVNQNRYWCGLAFNPSEPVFADPAPTTEVAAA